MGWIGGYRRSAREVAKQFQISTSSVYYYEHKALRKFAAKFQLLKEEQPTIELSSRVGDARSLSLGLIGHLKKNKE